MAEPATQSSDWLSESFEPGKGGSAAPAAPAGGIDLDSMLKPNPNLQASLLETQRHKVEAEDTQYARTNSRYEEDRAMMRDAFKAEQAAAQDGLKPWDAKAERQKYQSDPIQDFGSFASVFAIAASAFTKTPMVNALNASASAMNAIRERKDEEYKLAYTAWKDNTELAIKRGNMMHQQYADVATLMHSDMSVGEQKMREIAIRFGDQATLALMEGGMYPQIWENMAAKAKSVEGMTKALAETDLYTMRKKAFTQWEEQNPTASPMEKMTQFNELMGVKETDEQQWNRQYWASHKPSGDKKTDYESWLGEYKRFKEASSPYRFTTGTQNASELARRMDEYAKQFEVEGHPADEARRMGFDKANSEIASAKQHPKIDLNALGWGEKNIEASARTYNKTGMMPQRIGTRDTAAAVTAAVLNKANELSEAQGISPETRAKNWQQYAAEKVAIQRFESGPQGNTIRSLGVVVDHLGTLRRLADALHNGNIPAVNSLMQKIAQETGSSVPTNFDMAKNIVGTEIIKSLGVAGAGTQAERQEAAEAFSRRGSPRQISEGIDKVMRPLMLGQLKGLERQFVQSTGLDKEAFYRGVGPEAESFMRGTDQNKLVPTQVDIDWAKKSPERRKQFADKFGREP